MKRALLISLLAAAFASGSEVVVDFENATVLHPDTKANRVEKWTDKGVTFQLAHEPRKSKSKGMLGFFAHLPSERKGIVSAMALEAIPVRATLPSAASTVTLVLWGSSQVPAVVEAFDAEGKVVDRAAITAIPAKKSPDEATPLVTLTVNAPRIAYVQFSGARAGEFLVADELRFTPAAESRFEKAVVAYEEQDKSSPPPVNPVLLIGDSQFYRWKTLAEDLPGYTIVNRGIDSFQFSDILHYFDRLVGPYRGRMIFLHVGGNDVHNGKDAARLLQDFKTFAARVRETQPEVLIVFSSITPGPGRWDEAAKRIEANETIRQYVSTQKNLAFLDLWTPMLTADGKPREELWVADRVHPNQEGYRIRAGLMKPLLGPAK